MSPFKFPTSIYFATTNLAKIKDFSLLFGNCYTVKQFKLNLPEIQGSHNNIAHHKLDYALQHIPNNKCLIIEDTALELECIRGLPGPYIKEFIDKFGMEGIFELTQKLQNSNATARCIVGFGVKNRVIYKKLYSGFEKGNIVSPKGNGYGWEAIFKPGFSEKTYAEMNEKEKLHNYRAEPINEIRKRIEEIIGM